MTQPNLQHQVLYSLPLGDLLALGKALYLADPTSLAEKGLTEEDAEAVQRVFESLDDALEKAIGPDWLGSLEDLEEFADNVTPFAKLIGTMK